MNRLHSMNRPHGSPMESSRQTLTKLTLAGGSGVFTDQPPTNRFYRAELIP